MDIVVNVTATGTYALIGVGALGLLGLLTLGGMVLSAVLSPEYQRERAHRAWHKRRMNRYQRAKERAAMR